MCSIVVHMQLRKQWLFLLSLAHLLLRIAGMRLHHEFTNHAMCDLVAMVVVRTFAPRRHIGLWITLRGQPCVCILLDAYVPSSPLALAAASFLAD